MKEILKRILLSKGLFGGTFWSSFGLVSNSVFYFLFLSLAGKLLGAKNLGVLGVFYSFYMSVSFFFGSGFRDYVVRRISELKAKNEYFKIKSLIDEAHTYLFLLFIFTFFLFIIFKDLILKRLFNSNLFIFYNSYLAFFFLTTSILGRGFLIGKKIFSIFSVLIFLRGLLFLSIGLFLYINHIKNINFFVLTYTLSEFSNFLFYLFYLFYLKRGISFRFNMGFLKKGIFSMSFSNTSFQSFFNYPILLMKIKNVSDHIIGNLTAELSIFHGLRIFFASFFIPVYPHISSAYYSGDKKNFYKTIYLSFSLIFILVFLFTILFLLWGKTILYFFFPKKSFIFYEKEFIFISLALFFHLISRFFSRVYFASENHFFVFISLIFWLLIFTFPYLIIKSENEIIYLLTLLIFSTIILSVVFTFYFIKFFKIRGSIPEKKIIEE